MHNNHFNQQSIRILIISAVICFTLYIIYLTCSLSMGEQFDAKVNAMTTSIVSNYCIHMYKSSSAITTYVTKDADSSSQSLTSVIGRNIFPIQQYCSKNTDTTSISYTETIHQMSQTLPVSTTTPLPVTTTTPDNTSVEPSETEPVLDNETYYEDNDEYDAETAANITDNLSNDAKAVLADNKKLISQLRSGMNRSFLIENFFQVSSKTAIDPAVFNVKNLLSKDLSIEKDSDKPQILIYHTHANEWFADSDRNKKSDLMLGVGDELTRILRDEYGYNVLHHKGIYDTGIHKKAYNKALPNIEQILKENPSIKVIFDLHRDSATKHTSVTIDGVKMAKVMFFNGVSYNTNGPIRYLYNKNLQTNLAFSLQMKLKAMETYPEFSKRIFLKNYRYNMHLVGRYSLIEVGDNMNTVKEAKNAMKPLAYIIDQVLKQ